jgi:CRP-like cAMP-binding protein
MGAHLTTTTLIRDDVVLNGWVGLGKLGSSGDSLIGVLLPGDRIGAVLDGRLCTGLALTPVSLTSEEDGAYAPLGVQHLVRQCFRTCHFGAADRVEDFFLETYERLEAVGLASNWTFDLPLPQATLGNILGLSTAHVNRVIKQLQSQSRIEIFGRSITLLEPRISPH